ncbi:MULTISPECIES: UDP-N-acetylglucosamine 1-carboxyvinyltransferase [unclassified Gemella]|uniref:UDP-N-acetylglucosamine 1-carboxyvinyltransferase n=1 Tax=unclassified Gemella TaxID=2624949 RepID=UPI0010745BBF|nr:MULTISPECIES: UDP-N-acetylglucosamine 1-carboxyvinyltransferase [unclassified Gemella]MBF0710307.1 UDP-N-acetylglucosamine 1-carboxyvinyltransferase [Gemella sp. GL1.1]MBF0746983.1 UDP-N-acetylglucosamine 1-carboxyvinyltransferase [Gemella sp. 19428wG2_WT2a]NYS27651.1 UDP-N-acetylglucosamine 1-carboxyvinyltransferase [Gemella sp. GL1]TFU58801.1 UDP-N-acetylglucosamine 1-carboxyvinyltransferase [Gemella sp. WT2a]
MSKILVKGGTALKGEVQIDGAKNAVLPIVTAAALATEGVSKLTNVPNLSDVKIISNLLTSLGVKVDYNQQEKTLEIDAREKLKTEAEFEFVSKMRASFLVAAPILAREGYAHVAMPGGCAIGGRPIGLHLKGFEHLGAKVVQDAGYVELKAEEGLKGTTIFFDFPSVGATQNVVMAACLAEGTTILENAAQEPEIGDMIDFLTKMGAKISGKNTATLVIEGVEKLTGAEYAIMPDRVEAATYMIAAAATKGDVLVKGARYRDNVALVAKMREMGVTIEVLDENSMRVTNTREFLNPTDVKTLPHPGFLTDMQSQMMVLMLLAKGTSTITETVFENRFMNVEELRRMNAKIRIEGRTALIEGGVQLEGANVKATDLRAGASLIISGLIAHGETIIRHIEHIDRGYVDVESKFRKLGADIVRIVE